VSSLSLRHLLSRTRSPAADTVGLVRAELPRVERLLGRMLGPRNDLEDLVQAVFLEALRSADNYRAEGSPGAFIGGIAVRVARRAMRGTAFSRRRAELSEEPPAEGGDPEEAASRAQLLHHLQRALARLAPKKRIAFSLWALEGMSVAEIAVATGSSVAATRSQIFYAQKELRSMASRDPILRSCLGDAP
jgi:RNA polymerase sigma-70 factor (ECF subfamily)